jgi:large subunit ribosomal protein L4
MKATTFSKAGAKAAEATLPKTVFEVEVNEQTLQQAIVRSQANLRVAKAKTLTRAEVRGGGRKPWRQKGTGRARFGSSRVPIWRSGGVAHGPTGLQNYTKDMPANMVRSSIRMALSAQAKNIVVIEKFELTEPKTHKVIEILEKISAEGNVIILIDTPTENTLLACANVPACRIIRTNQLRAYEVLTADTIVVEKSALDTLETWLGKKAAKPVGVSK